MQRIVQPEILDTLPHDHPDALHNRRDLLVINRFMGNFRWFLRTLPPLLRPGERVLELGAGMGELGHLLHAQGIWADGLDLRPRPKPWPANREWHEANLLSFDGYGSYPVVIANLLLHQFGNAELSEIGARLRRSARLILVCEPARLRRAQAVFAAVGPALGANHVSRHDGHVSIAAGFLDDELPRALGLDDGAWSVRCTRGSVGSYRMVAVRKD